MRNLSPTRILPFIIKLQPWIGALAVPSLLIGLYLALWVSPADYQQKEMVRILYVHVPCAWLGSAFYGMMALLGIAGYIWRQTVALVAVRALAPLGLMFTVLCIATGMLWGKPIWGAWWVWDARLTSVAVMVVLYIIYFLILQLIEDPDEALQKGALFTVMGSLNLPLIKGSVTWWNTLHQPATVFRIGGPRMDSSMLWPLGFMVLGMTLMAVWLAMLRLQTLVANRKYVIQQRLRLRQDG